MKKIPFNIDYRPQIESGACKVVTRNDRPVEIKMWDLKGSFPVVGVYYDDVNDRDLVVQVTAEGRCSMILNDDSSDDFFIITNEPDGLEFKQGGWYLCTKTHMFFEKGELYYCHRDGHIDDGCGRAYIGEDGYNIKYFQPITEIKEVEQELKNLIPDWKKNVKEFKKSVQRLIDLAKQALQEEMLKQPCTTLFSPSAYYEQGKADTLKTMPKWKRCVLSCGVEEETNFLLKGSNNTYFLSNIIKYNDLYLRLSELERLSKEE